MVLSPGNWKLPANRVRSATASGYVSYEHWFAPIELLRFVEWVFPAFKPGYHISGFQPCGQAGFPFARFEDEDDDEDEKEKSSRK